MCQTNPHTLFHTFCLQWGRTTTAMYQNVREKAGCQAAGCFRFNNVLLFYFSVGSEDPRLKSTADRLDGVMHPVIH